MNPRKSWSDSRYAARVMRCVVAMGLLVFCLWKCLYARVTPDLFDHADLIPLEAEGVQNPIVDRPGTTAHRVGLIPFTERGAILQAAMEHTARLELAMDIIHKFVTAHIGKAAPLEHPGGGIGERLEEIGAMPEHGKECIDLLEDHPRATQSRTDLSRCQASPESLRFCF